MTPQIAPPEAINPGIASTAQKNVLGDGIAQRLKALSVRPQGLTVRELIDRYMLQYDGADTTRVQRLSAWSIMLGDFTIEALDSDVLHAARTEIAAEPALAFKGTDHLGNRIFKTKPGGKPKTPATINRYMQAISAVFTWAQEQRLTPRGWVHPCRGIKRLKGEKERVRFLDDAERQRLFNQCRASRYPRLYALVLSAYTTGARLGELLALRWRDVDLAEGIAYLGKTKNGDRRTLVLLPNIIEVLTPFQGDADRYVFGSVRSKHQAPASIDSAFRDAVTRAKIKDFHFHDLRHCCASRLAQAGTPLNVIAEVLGHRKLDMSKRYAHLTTQTKAQALRASLGEIK